VLADAPAERSKLRLGLRAADIAVPGEYLAIRGLSRILAVAPLMSLRGDLGHGRASPGDILNVASEAGTMHFPSGSGVFDCRAEP
jgi:hypothetical protein